MRAKDVIKLIMERTGVNNARLASRLGLTQQAMWERLNSKRIKDLSVVVLADMLRVLDYKIVVVPASTRVPEGGYVVNGLPDTE